MKMKMQAQIKDSMMFVMGKENEKP